MKGPAERKINWIQIYLHTCIYYSTATDRHTSLSFFRNPALPLIKQYSCSADQHTQVSLLQQHNVIISTLPRVQHLNLLFKTCLKTRDHDARSTRWFLKCCYSVVGGCYVVSYYYPSSVQAHTELIFWSLQCRSVGFVAHFIADQLDMYS